MQISFENVAFESSAHDEKKREATISIYKQNYKTVASKLLETVLEDHELIPNDENRDRLEQVKTSVLPLEGAEFRDHLLLDQFSDPLNCSKDQIQDNAAASVHAAQPCDPSSNLTEEYCNEFINLPSKSKVRPS